MSLTSSLNQTTQYVHVYYVNNGSEVHMTSKIKLFAFERALTESPKNMINIVC